MNGKAAKFCRITGKSKAEYLSQPKKQRHRDLTWARWYRQFNSNIEWCVAKSVAKVQP